MIPVSEEFRDAAERVAEESAQDLFDHMFMSDPCERNTYTPIDVSKLFTMDMTPFFAKALVQKENILADIDAAYEKNKYKYYQAAKTSPLYDHGIVRESVIEVALYYRKIIGIFACASNGDAEASEIISTLYKKAYRRLYNFLRNQEEVDFVEYTLMVRRNYKDFGLEGYNNILIAFLYFTMAYKIRIQDENHELEQLMKKMLSNLCDYYSTNSERTINLEKNLQMHPELKEACQEYRKYINKNNYYDQILSFNTPYSYIFDLEKISISQILEGVKFGQKEIDEMTLAYELSKKQGYEEVYEDYMVPAIYIRVLCREYKKTKNLYLKDNQEEVQLKLYEKNQEVSKKLLEREEENKRLQLSLQSLQQENEKLSRQIEQLQKDLGRSQAQKNIEENEKKELHALRKFAYNQTETETTAAKDKEIPYDKLKETKCVLIGGHENWVMKMKRYFPKWCFIGPNVSSFDGSVLKNADHIFIFTDYCAHKLYYKALGNMPDRKDSYSYLSSVNMQRNLQLISETLGLI